jgi:very-short-patch-repair endonuclease
VPSRPGARTVRPAAVPSRPGARTAPAAVPRHHFAENLLLRVLIRRRMQRQAAPMREAQPFKPQNAAQTVALPHVLLSERQEGVVHRDQLLEVGMTRHVITRMRRRGELHRVFGCVYAVGHRNLSLTGRLTAALLHAGPHAALAYWTALHWWGLLEVPRSEIHVVTSTRARPAEGLVVHHRHEVHRAVHRNLAVTPVARTIRDVSPQLTVGWLRKIIAEAEYRRILDLPALEAEVGRGRAGTKKVQTALKLHQPRLAKTHSELERAFLRLLERHGLPMPQVNHLESRMRVDMVWPDRKVAVELDGHDGHRTPAQLNRDHRRDLELRARGYTVLRYTYDQVMRSSELVIADLCRALGLG